MSVVLEDDDFAQVIAALRKACSGYSEDEIEEVILAERAALRILESYAT